MMACAGSCQSRAAFIIILLVIGELETASARRLDYDKLRKLKAEIKNADGHKAQVRPNAAALSSGDSSHTQAAASSPEGGPETQDGQVPKWQADAAKILGNVVNAANEQKEHWSKPEVQEEARKAVVDFGKGVRAKGEETVAWWKQPGNQEDVKKKVEDGIEYTKGAYDNTKYVAGVTGTKARDAFQDPTVGKHAKATVENTVDAVRAMAGHTGDAFKDKDVHKGLQGWGSETLGGVAAFTKKAIDTARDPAMKGKDPMEWVKTVVTTASQDKEVQSKFAGAGEHANHLGKALSKPLGAAAADSEVQKIGAAGSNLGATLKGVGKHLAGIFDDQKTTEILGDAAKVSLNAAGSAAATVRDVVTNEENQAQALGAANKVKEVVTKISAAGDAPTQK